MTMKYSKRTFYNSLIYLENQSNFYLLSISLLLVFLLGVIDYLTGFRYSFSFFYLIPISIAAWGVGRVSGLSVSIISAMTWAVSNYLAGEPFEEYVTIWNTLMRLGFFVVFTILLHSFRNVLEEERKLSRTDPLTGAFNRRAFYEIIATKTMFGQRKPTPCSLVYIDIDNFKNINDTLGHLTGDAVLVTVVETRHNNIRDKDFLARLGGDEFSILLTETDQSIAQIVTKRIQSKLIEAMKEQKWEVTFSIGVLTFMHFPSNIGQMISMTDQLMYQVKGEGKDAIIYSIYDG